MFKLLSAGVREKMETGPNEGKSTNCVGKGRGLQVIAFEYIKNSDEGFY